MNKEKISKAKIGGISARMFTIPLFLIISVMLILTVYLTADVHHASNRLSDQMKKCGEYQIESTEILACNTVLSETSNSYIQMPLNADNSVNFGSLITYIAEYNGNRRSEIIVNNFRQYKVSNEVMAYIEEAATQSEQMIAVQIHAISVMNTVHPLPNIPDLQNVFNEELTDEENAMTLEERELYAKNLLLKKEYTSLRYHVSQNIQNCNLTLQQEFSQLSEKTHDHVIAIRITLWCVIGLIMLVLGIAFHFFYKLIIKPLRVYSKSISENQSIKETTSLTEMKQLATAFNNLWSYRNKLESILRNKAENDALTGLPNRYSMEKDLIEKDNEPSSLAVLLFDINFLKQTNDTYGHLAGDKLICTAANCIKKCFGTETNDNCYRIGGDEFVALLSNIDKQEVLNKIEKFNKCLTKEKISVSVGYAFDSTTNVSNFQNLIAEADRKMYEQKRRIHEMENLK